METKNVIYTLNDIFNGTLNVGERRLYLHVEDILHLVYTLKTSELEHWMTETESVIYKWNGVLNWTVNDWERRLDLHVEDILIGTQWRR